MISYKMPICKEFVSDNLHGIFTICFAYAQKQHGLVCTSATALKTGISWEFFVKLYSYCYLHSSQELVITMIQFASSVISFVLYLKRITVCTC